MVAVKASKQYQMVVVPYRPFYKACIFLLCCSTVTAVSWLAYKYGLDRSLVVTIEAVQEREILKQQLSTNSKLVVNLKQEITTLKLGSKIDTRATEEVRQTVETLQSKIAELHEEIKFYKGVMLPNVDNKGLRIERLTLKALTEANKFSYSLLLTQIVEKHRYIQGNVKINLLGKQGSVEQNLDLARISQTERNSFKFRFQYFQNINGEMSLPSDFKAERVIIVAQSSGRNPQRVEKRFDWKFGG